MKLAIIGSGISGLSAAFFASQAGFKVHLITGTVGGITSTIYENGWEFDIGPQIVKLSPAAISLIDIATHLNLASEIQTSLLDSDDKLVYYNGKLRSYSERPDFNPPLTNIDIKAANTIVDDETIFDFYSKYRLSDNNNEHSYILNVLMDASVRSYYSAGVKDISARTSNMTSADFKKRYNLTTPPTKFYKSSQPLSQSLYSKFKSSGVKSIRFKGGWSTLNSSILSYLSHNSCHITESSVTSISPSEKTLTLSDGSVHSFDHLISSINSDSLSGLLPNLEFKIKHIDWKILNLGYNSPPKLASFGYAVPGIENSNIFASVFNYNCFRENKPSVTILGKGDFDLIIKEFIKQSSLPYPDEAVGRTLESASPVYAVGHYKQQDLMASLPSWLHVIGHSFFHSGVPSCIIRAHETVSKILSK